MARRNFAKTSGIMVDDCPHHGTWLDQGELLGILDFLAAGGMERTRAFEEREAEHQKNMRASMKSIDRNTRKHVTRTAGVTQFWIDAYTDYDILS